MLKTIWLALRWVCTTTCELYLLIGEEAIDWLVEQDRNNLFNDPPTWLFPKLTVWVVFKLYSNDLAPVPKHVQGSGEEPERRRAKWLKQYRRGRK